MSGLSFLHKKISTVHRGGLKYFMDDHHYVYETIQGREVQLNNRELSM